MQLTSLNIELIQFLVSQCIKYEYNPPSQDCNRVVTRSDESLGPYLVQCSVLGAGSLTSSSLVVFDIKYFCQINPRNPHIIILPDRVSFYLA